MDTPRLDTIFSTDPADADKPPSLGIAGYQLLREIGRGGQAVVYLATQNVTGRKVAVKVMREGPLADARQRARFEREVQILAGLHHPNIVSVLDRGMSVDGSQYLVMNYVVGQPLDEYLKVNQSTLDIQRILRLFLKIAEAVNAAHLAGVVHRDLKPSNIRIDERGEPHVLDFGLARPAMGGRSTDADRFTSITGVFFGSLPWASPEQAEGQTPYLDARTDVYSLGVILCQMLSGEFPYPVNGSAHEILNNILHTTPESPSKLARNSKASSTGSTIRSTGQSKINRQIDRVILMALAKRKEDRYQSAGEMARDLSNAIEGLPITAKDRRRRSVPSASLLIATCVIVAVASLALVMKKRHQSFSGGPATSAVTKPAATSLTAFSTPVGVMFTTGAQQGEQVLGWTEADATSSFALQLDVRIIAGTDAVLISKRARNDDGGLSVFIRHDGALSVAGEAANYRVMLNGSHPVNDGRWHQVRIVKTGKAVQLIVDGELDVTGVVRDSFSSKSPWRLGPAPLGSWEARWLASSLDANFKNISIQPNLSPQPTIQEETATTKPPVNLREVDLLALIDPKRDAVTGSWSRTDKGIVSDDTGHARIRIPYHPPGEYDFRVTFTRLSGGQCVTQILSRDDHRFCWQIGGYNSSICGFDRIGAYDLNYAGNPSVCIDGAGWIGDGQLCTSLVKVRKTGITAYLDDRLICSWKTDYTDMTPDPDWDIPGRFLGLGSHSSPTIFHTATLVEVTGRGKPIEPRENP